MLACRHMLSFSRYHHYFLIWSSNETSNRFKNLDLPASLCDPMYRSASRPMVSTQLYHPFQRFHLWQRHPPLLPLVQKSLESSNFSKVSDFEQLIMARSYCSNFNLLTSVARSHFSRIFLSPKS